MTTLKKMARHLPWILALLMPRCVLAHGGEDHGDEARAPVNLSAPGPQLELKSPEVELVGMVQGYEFEGYHRTIDTHIKNLRKKIAEHLPDKDVIHSVYGTGYRFSLDTVKL